MRLTVNQVLPLAALVMLNGCAFGGGREVVAQLPQANGPSADYPVVIGEPFVIAGETHTPNDQLNYDAVGYALVAAQGGETISASHKTLPLPSYVEVTSLDSGRTILVRVETRGPMSNDLLVELSPGAAAQLGVDARAQAPVRVRRVNPPEPDRALLRAGKQAPERMATPEALLKVLTRKLAENKSLAAASSPAPVESVPDMSDAIRDSVALQSATAPAAPDHRAAQPTGSLPTDATAPATAGLVVQVAAFSTRERADAAAQALGANVSKPGKYWTVRLGPFASTAAASEGLAKARAAGYRDARIQRDN